MPKSIEAVSKDRYRATAAQKRMFGGSTVTEFWIYVDGEMAKHPRTGEILVISGFGKYPGNRKAYALDAARKLLNLS